jgi:hypothetical protein
MKQLSNHILLFIGLLFTGFIGLLLFTGYRFLKIYAIQEYE